MPCCSSTIRKPRHSTSSLSSSGPKYTRVGPSTRRIAALGRWAASASSQSKALLVSEGLKPAWRSEEHTSELQSLMRISYDVFCLKKKINSISIENSQIYQKNDDEECDLEQN